MKQFKKVVASALALAMVVTAIPTADAQAAAKAPKLNNYKKILYVGQSYTLKVNNLPANWKKCTYTWSTSNKSIATIKKGKYGQAASVKAVKAGKTTITTKMTYPQTAAQKKAKKKTVKTFKCAVTVKNPTLTVKASATTLAVGKTTKLSVSKAPSNAKVAFSSSDKTVATVSSNGTVKAVAPGKAVITVTSTVGTKKLTKKVTITVAGEEGITAALANPLSSEYPTTVLVSDQAVIKVSVVEDGKPVAGRTIVGTITKTEGQAPAGNATVNGIATGVTPSYEIKGNNAAVTDANGVATFVIGNTKSNVKSYDIQYASVNFKAQDANSSKTIESIVSFATVKNADITNINNKNLVTTDDLVPGVNYNTVGHNGLALTASMDAPHSYDDEYVESQQVSSADADEHKVGFTGGYPVIYLPDTAGDLSNASKEVEEINHKSDAYHTYANDSYYYTIKKDPSKLTYATINFDNVTISKYTKLVVETFKSEADAKAATTVPSGASLDKKEYRGELTQSSFAYQVPLNTTYKGLCVKVTLVSQGQVDAAKNAGYNVKNITYVYKTKTGTTPEPLPLKGATMSWSIVDTPMTAEEDIFTTSTQATKNVGNATISVQAGGKITKKVPAFPYTGPAVITVYDANGKVVSYYACATKNQGNNTNDFDIDDTSVSCYEISVDELRDKVGEIVSQDTTSVWVDSKKSGRTTLEGTVKVDGKELQLDAETNTVYTSVQWNPIPKAATVTASDAFVALLGQKIEVVAQLTDKNGNAVTLPGQGITFSYTKQRPTPTTTAIDLAPAGDTIVEGTVSGKDATIVSGQSKTDSNGQSKLILKASDITEITNITAESQNAGYDVVLKVADKTTKQADLYWIDADLAFVDSAYDSTSYTTANKPIETVTTGIEPKVGETWEYGVKTVGTKFAKPTYVGALADKTINIDNLGITMTKTSDSVGTVDTNTGVNGMVKATSTKASTTKIVSTIDAKTLTDKVTVSQGTFAGTGAASVSKKLTLNVNWKNDGMSAEVLSPAGTFVYGNSTTVYVKVADAYGNAPKNATDVTFKVDDATAQLDSEVAGASKTVSTNSDGIAEVTLTKGVSSKRTTVVATVSGISDNVFAQTYNWVTTADITSDLEIEKNANAETGKYQTVFDKDTKTITMTFTDDILPSSVVKEQFAVAYDSNTYVVDEATVNNNVITLKLADVPVTTSASKNFTVTITSEPVKGVTYTVTSVQGVQLYNGEVITFAADKGNSAPSQANSTTYSANKTTTDDNSSDITTDASTLVTDLTNLVDEPTSTTMQGKIAAGGTNSTSFALTKVSDAKGILGTDGTITFAEAGAEATFTVTVSKGTGFTAGKSVTKTFKVKINADNNKYTVTEVQ